MKATKRLVLILAAMGAMVILLSSGVAVAETINGTEGSDTLEGTDYPDYVYGHGGDDTIDGGGYYDWVLGGPGNDTLKDRSGWDLGWWGDVFAGEDGDDLIDATTKYAYDGTYIAPWTGGGVPPYADLIYCGNGFDRVWYDRFDYAEGYYGQATGPVCESMMRIDWRTSDYLKGAFYREGSSVTFEGYPLSGGDKPGGNPYDKMTISGIWVNNKPFNLGVDPKAGTITQASYAAYGYPDSLTEADRKAVRQARAELARFLDANRSTLKNQEYLVLQHLDHLASKPAGYRFANGTEDYTPKDQPLAADVAERLGPPDDPNVSARKRVNLATGNAYEQKQDLSVPGGRGLPFKFARAYNSKDTYEGPLGYGWTHDFNVSLKEEADGSVTYFGPQGARKKFARNADGSYSPPRGVHDTLTKASDGAFSLRKKAGVEWLFDTGGRLQKIADPNGNAISLSYTDGRLTGIVDTVGRQTTLAYDASGRIATLTDPANRTVKYAYDASGNLVSVTDPLGNVTGYRYDALHNLTQIDNPDGGHLYLDYDYNNRAVASYRDDNAYRAELSYDQVANSTTAGKSTVTDSKGNQSAFSYDGFGDVTKITDPYAKNLSYTFDSDGNRTSRTDQLGNTQTMAYDAKGNLTKLVQPKPTSNATTNPTTTLTYEPTFNRLTSLTDPLGATTSLAYDNEGNLTSLTDALNEVTTFERDAYGELSKATDAKNRLTSFLHDAQGNLTEVTDPDQKKTLFAYDSIGWRTSLTDKNGNKTSFERDALGRVTKLTRPKTGGLLSSVLSSAATVLFSYDAMGRKTSLTDENGNERKLTYDSQGQLTKATDALLKETLYDYDTEGNLTSKTDPLGNRTSYGFDALRRPTEVTRAAGTRSAASYSYGYDDAGRRTSVTDPKGQTTSFSRDALGRLSGVTDPSNGATSLERDLLGRVTGATNPNGHATAYAHDALGRLTEETDPLGNATSFAYDETGAMKSKTDANSHRTDYAHDKLDRLTGAAYPDGTQVQATYDAVGNLLSLSDSTGTTSYEYDQRNRPTKETLPGDRVLEREYDAAGNRTALTDPDGKQTSYEYDEANRLVALTDGEGDQTTYTYDDRNRPVGVSYPSGAGESLAYDPLGRVASATATGTGGSVLSKLSYSYDANSNPTSISNEKNEQSTFAYDALDRLTQEAHPQKKSLSYTYDAAGNRQSMTEGATTTNYAYDAAERMTRAGSDTFSYDANGNMTGHTNGSTTTDYSYDSKARLIQAGEKTYQRDAFGRVASSTEGGTKTDYLFDGQQVIQEKKQAGDSAATTSYTRGLGGRLVSRRAGSGAPSYYHHDAIGSVIGLSDSAGKLTDTYAYDAFGNGRARTGTSEQPYGYLGNAYEPSTGLYDFHARHYDPGNGRFLSKDPIKGLPKRPQTLNPYPCSLNNPLRFPDPSGLYPGDPEEQFGQTLTGDPYPQEGGEDYTGQEEAVPFDSSEDCGPVPKSPPGASLDENIRDAEYASYAPYFGDAYFVDQVRPGGPQDYKEQSPPEEPLKYEDFGNFNFGATGAAQGYSDQELQRGAGAEQIGNAAYRSAKNYYNGNPDAPTGYSSDFGTPLGGPPYGDDPNDQEQIQTGIDYYNCINGTS